MFTYTSRLDSLDFNDTSFLERHWALSNRLARCSLLHPQQNETKNRCQPNNHPRDGNKKRGCTPIKLVSWLLWKNDMDTFPIEKWYICFFHCHVKLNQKEKKIWSHFAGLFSSSWEQHCRSVCLVSPLPYLASSQADPVPVALDLIIKKIFPPNGGGEKWWWIQWWFHYGHNS